MINIEHISKNDFKIDARIAFIYSDSPGYVRVAKTLPLLKRIFNEVHFIGATRKDSWPDSRIEGINYHIINTQMEYGLKTVFKRIQFDFFIRKTLKKIKPEYVIAINDEQAFPFAIRYFPRPEHLIIDMYDSVAMRVLNANFLVGIIYKWISRKALGCADALVEVNQERLNWYPEIPDKHIIVENTPEYLEKIFPVKGLSKNFIYVYGTVNEEINGLSTLLKAIEQVDDLEIVCTGKLIGEFANTVFKNHPKVHYEGFVDKYKDVFSYIAASKAVYCHESPEFLNFLMGAPNKLYEAMMVGRPLLINSENHASRITTEYKFGLLSPMYDVDGLVQQLKKIKEEEVKLSQDCQFAREIFKEKYAWHIMEKRWIELFKSLALKNINSGAK